MALKATIYKAEVEIADMDRHYFASHNLTLACHPSETEERLMARFLAFCMYAHEDLAFTKGLFDVDEPELWQKNLTDDILLWIDLGLPDETRIRKASQKAKQLVVFTYQDHHELNPWFKGIEDKISRFDNITIWSIDADAMAQLVKFANRTMRIQCNIQDGHFWLSDETQSLELTPSILYKSHAK